jgi:hypothetical protein
LSTKPPPPPLPGPDALSPPRSIADRWDIATAGGRPGCESRVCAAALGACWPEYRARHPYPGDPLGYGKALQDRLLADGHGWGEISTASIAAFRFLMGSLARVDGIADFSGPPSEPGGGPGGE